MRNIKLTIQYDGSRYKGWQGQKDNDLTVEGKLQAVIEKMTEENNVEIIGAERTDVGVHAENYVANFKTECTLSIELMKDYLYNFLPDDIVVKQMEEVDERFHARYNVKSKTYTYSIDSGDYRNVFNRKYAYHIDCELNISRMKEAALVLEGKHDFKNFTSVKSGSKSTVRDIEKIDIRSEANKVTIYIRANDFLWHMPRFLVGTLIAVGSGEMPIGAVQKLVTENTKATTLAKAKGLCLEEVSY